MLFSDWKRIFIDSYWTPYFVNSNGDIYSESSKRLKKATIGANGYAKMILYVNGIRRTVLVHRIVAQLFVPNDDNNKIEVNHKDGNKLNNQSNNLEWVSPSENIRHSISTGLRTNFHRKPVKQLDENGQVIQMFESLAAAATHVQGHSGKISEVCRNLRKTAYGYKWEYVD